MSANTKTSSSSKTIFAGICFAAILQNKQSGDMLSTPAQKCPNEHSGNFRPAKAARQTGFQGPVVPEPKLQLKQDDDESKAGESRVFPLRTCLDRRCLIFGQAKFFFQCCRQFGNL